MRVTTNHWLAGQCSGMPENGCRPPRDYRIRKSLWILLTMLVNINESSQQYTQQLKVSLPAST